MRYCYNGLALRLFTKLMIVQQITVSGPAVVLEKTTLTAQGRIRDDNTLELC